MAKKKSSPLEGMGKDPTNKLTVQKSRPLTALWQSEFSLAEFKIMDAYLARINSRNPEQRSVTLEKGQLETILGVTKINKADLKKRLRNLYSPIDLEDDNPKKLKLRALFEEADAEQDENGIWQIKLTCTQAAMKYIFNIEKLGYVKYKLRSIAALQSRYSYILFVYLESNRKFKTWEVEVSTLKEILNCATDPLYSEYWRFNERILKRCQKELHEKTECRFDYEPVKTGRRVTGVRFTLETLADSIEPSSMPGQLTLEDYKEDDPVKEALPDNLTPEQVEALRVLASPKVPWIPGSALPRECAIADYLRRKVLIMTAHNRKIKHPFSYLKTMIEQDTDAFYG